MRVPIISSIWLPLSSHNKNRIQGIVLRSNLLLTMSKMARYHWKSTGVMEWWSIAKYQISSTKSQTNLKFQYSMTKTQNRFGISNFGHCDLFDICDLLFGISIPPVLQYSTTTRHLYWQSHATLTCPSGPGLLGLNE